VASEPDPADEHQRDCDQIRHAERELDILKHEERNHHWKGGQEDEEEHGNRPEPVLCVQTPRRELAHAEQALTHAFEVLRLQDVCQDRRQGVDDQAMSVSRARGAVHRADREQSAPAFGQRAHDEHDGIHQPPGDVAPNRRDEQRPNLLTAGRGRTERAGERQRHDQPEEDL
jgi:hypothetical protein